MGKHRLLGSAVLVYAFLTSGALLSVAQGWAGPVNSALWLLFVLGGFGLIRGQGWGRALTLFAAGGSLIALVVLLIVGGDLELVYFFTVWSLFGLPALAILVSALLVKLPPSKDGTMPSPTGTARKPRISRRAHHCRSQAPARRARPCAACC